MGSQALPSIWARSQMIPSMGWIAKAITVVIIMNKQDISVSFNILNSILDKAALDEGCIFIIGKDDMVKDRDIYNFSGLYQFLCYADIFNGRFWVSGWMIVG